MGLSSVATIAGMPQGSSTKTTAMIASKHGAGGESMSYSTASRCRRYLAPALLALSGLWVAGVSAQLVSPPLGDGPWEVQTYQAKIKVAVVARGLAHPWSMEFLPDGAMLVTERGGNLRIIRDGVLDPRPIPGVPAVHAVRLSGLMEILLHPDFENNQLVYLTYTKHINDEPLEVATTLARGRFNGEALVDVQDILVADSWAGNGGSGSKIVFGPDGKLYMSTGASNGNAAQEGANLRGKVLRLNDDGTPAADNPFVGKPGFRPEVYSMGHRNILGLVFHPVTGELWSTEMGPNGGDEVNIIKPGANYGWPVVSFGRDYSGPFISPVPWKEGMEMPVSTFIPGISPSGLAFYTGTDFPTWTTSAFIGANRVGQIPGTAHLVRIFYDENGNERHRETLLRELGQRIRHIELGPDGKLYLLTDEEDGAVLVIEPADQ
jgi:glucose/arabinose dehydrogenase